MIHDMRSLTGHYLDAWVKEKAVRQAARRFGEPPPFDRVSNLPPLHARVYGGLWIVDCPCGGAEMVCKAHPIVWCCSCGNRYTDGLWRSIELPTNLAEIERLLDLRPFPINQNWLPGESAENLERENRILGVGT